MVISENLFSHIQCHFLYEKSNASAYVSDMEVAAAFWRIKCCILGKMVKASSSLKFGSLSHL